MKLPDEPLLAAANQMCVDPAFRAVVWRHCRDAGPRAGIGDLSTRIHPNDQMLLHSLKHHRDVNLSLSQYFNVALQQHAAARQIVKLLFDRPKEDLDVLDFACGYGRLLRFLCLGVPASRIWASDIQRDAVDFVVAEFGVNGIRSETEPERFEPGRTFDFIWVASLFSHLPEHLFRRWLARLLALLAPDGVLCFSVHDQFLLPANVAMPDQGICFFSYNENAELDASTYGTSYVTESFVRGAIADAGGNGHPSFRIRRGLANEQDIYVVPKAPGRDLGRLDAVRRGTWGWVDECRISGAGELRMSGWAASLDSGASAAVEISVDGRPHAGTTGQPRDDVRVALGDDRLAGCGWEFALALETGPTTAFLEVTARSGEDDAALLYAGPLAVPSRPQPGER